MGRHTPGPWKVRNWTCKVYDKTKNEKVFYRHYEYFDITGPADRLVERIKSQYDAHLIAAAPEMLEALTLWEMQLEADLSGVMRVLQEGERRAFTAMLNVCQSAIAKARGES